MILYENDAVKWNWITFTVQEPETVCDNIQEIMRKHSVDKVRKR